MRTILLISLTAALFSSVVLAKEMPEEYAESKSSVHATAAVKQPNRVYIEGHKIERAIYDASVLKVERDTLTGSIYAVPLTKEKTGLFVVSDSGVTHSLTLSPMDKITPQTISLKEKGSALRRISDDAVPSSSMPLEATVQTLLKMIPTLSEESSEPVKGVVTDGYLTANPMGAWTIGAYRLERYRAFNPTTTKIEVREPGFRSRGVVAVATEARELAPQASADLWIIREALK